jgi:hypothetical protein
MGWRKRNSSGVTGTDAQQLWGEVLGVDDRTDRERMFTIYTRSGSFLVIDDKGNERLAGPDSGLNKYDILREVMVQFQVHALRVKPSPNAEPPIV